MRTAERELRRLKGQFWTPQWVARAMVRHAMPKSGELLDPAFGTGAFQEAFAALAGDATGARFHGREVDAELLREFRLGNPSATDCVVELRDFILDPPRCRFAGIVANPPYVRHHSLSPETKAAGRRLCMDAMGTPLDARAGLHVYFLVQSLLLLEEGGRLAMVLPADVCEGVFARPLWDWIASRFRIDCVATFAPEATPFPGIDVNPIVLFISNAQPGDLLCWARISSPSETAFDEFVKSGFAEADGPCLTASRRPLAEALETGISRKPSGGNKPRYTLGDFAVVRRGIVSGDNSFFLMTRESSRARGIPPEFLLPAVARVRDIDGDAFDGADLDRLDARGRPTLLFSPGDGQPGGLPPSVRRYLDEGEAAGVPDGAVCRSRRPWHRLERRTAPPILFAYLGRRDCRFVRNIAGALALNGFHCVYPRSAGPGFAEALWHVLADERTTANLGLVGKTYGNGAIKVEPRALERLPLPVELIDLTGLDRDPCP